MKESKSELVCILTDFATELLIIHANNEDVDTKEKLELKLKKAYASKIKKHETNYKRNNAKQKK